MNDVEIERVCSEFKMFKDSFAKLIDQYKKIDKFMKSYEDTFKRVEK